MKRRSVIAEAAPGGAKAGHVTQSAGAGKVVLSTMGFPSSALIH
jgi:hypothetical protein